jgi:3-hydroxybutyryl-CoA dehydrogenase
MEKDYIAGRLAKGKMTQEQADTISKKLCFVDSLEEAAKDADVVIEAIIEDEEVKKDFFKKLDKIVRKDTLVVSNSSRMVSSLFKDSISNPSRLANFHYFNLH